MSSSDSPTAWCHPGLLDYFAIGSALHLIVSTTVDSTGHHLHQSKDTIIARCEVRLMRRVCEDLSLERCADARCLLKADALRQRSSRFHLMDGSFRLFCRNLQNVSQFVMGPFCNKSAIVRPQSTWPFQLIMTPELFGLQRWSMTPPFQAGNGATMTRSLLRFGQESRCPHLYRGQ
jgi:hypothetical protein